MKKKVLAAVLVTGLFSIGPLPAQLPGVEVEPYEWEVSTAEEQGLDSAIFDNAFREAEQFPRMYSLLVVRNGYLIAEQYFHQQDERIANYIASASKSYISALVGIAIREGFIASLDQPMMDFLPDYITPDLDPRKLDVTIRHLLTMRAGFPYDSTDKIWGRWRASSDWIEFCLGHPLAADPGETWAYSTASTHLLSVIITRASGMSTLEFARAYLFEPLDITIGRWVRDPQGYYKGGWDMYFAPRDMARFGYLYLNEGKVDGKQIIPRYWVRRSSRSYSEVPWDWGVVEESGYGYLWWIGRLVDYDVYYAHGHGGQNILNIPELDMVIVTSTDARSSFDLSWEHTLFVARFIAHHILLPVRDFLGPAPHGPSEIGGMRVENRSLARREYINMLNWSPNPRNHEVDVSAYRVYRFAAGGFRIVGEVAADTFEYWHRGPEDVYGITAVTHDGSESLPAVVVAREVEIPR